MTTPTHPRHLRVVVAAAVIGVAAVLVGVLIAIVTTALTGHASPLPTTAPWQWSLQDIAHWFSSDATSASALDVAVRILATVAWLAVAVIVINLLRELFHQARHGVIRRTNQPANASTQTTAAPQAGGRAKVRRQHGFAATIVAVLLGGATLVAGTATALPARTPTAAVIDTSIADTAPTVAGDDSSIDEALPAGWHWGTHTINSPHESLASIARHLGDDPTLARTIWDANHDHDMGHGERFSDPAVVKLGWTLRVPTPPSTPAPGSATQDEPVVTSPVGDPVASAAPSHVVITEPGDTMWDQIDDVVDTPTAADVHAVAQRADGTTTALGPWVFDADNPDLIHPGMTFDLQPAIDLHAPPSPDTADTLAPSPAAAPALEAAPPATIVTAGTTSADAQVPVNAETSASTPPAAPAATIVSGGPPPELASPPSGDDPVITLPAPTALPGPVIAMPPPPGVQPGDIAPIAPDTVEVEVGDDASQLPIVPLAAAGMTIGGLLIALDRRRRRRQAHDPDGRPVALPDSELAQHERVIRAAARLDRAARANAALRHLSDELAERATILRARYILVDDTNVTVALDQPALAPDGWASDPHDPRRWRCTLDDTALAYAADINPHPWPALVPLGVTIDNDATLLVDLEALGSTALTGPGGADVIAAIICALGSSPHADMLTVVDDGHVALYGLEPYLANRISIDGIDQLLERLEAWIEPFRFEARHLLTQRHDDPGELEPCVAAIVARIDDTARTRLQHLPLDGTRPIAVLSTDPTIARTLIDVDDHGLATFDGQTIRCHRLTPAVAVATRQLINHADAAPPTTTPRTPVSVEQPALFPPDPDAWTIATLGPLRIHHHQHGDLRGDRHRQLLTLLALHPHGLSGDDIYDALVPDKIADPDTKRRYVKARISDLRKQLGGGDTITGRAHLPITSTAGTDRYRVHHLDVDLTRFNRLAAHPNDLLTDLSAAMELIDGEIGGGELSWFPWATPVVHEIHALIVDTGRRLGVAAITAGQPGLADWAATQTRLAVPYDQSVVPLAIQARSLLGDRVGVRRLRDEIVDTHNGDLATDVKAAFDDALAAG